MFGKAKQNKGARKGTFICPDCSAQCRVTNTKYITPIFKESYASCTNDHCGGRYVFESQPVRVLCPSQTPNPKINLPLAQGVRPIAELSDGQIDMFNETQTKKAEPC